MDNQEISFKDEVEQLTRKTQAINEQVMKFNLRLENHQSNYKKNIEIAKSKFGTDDFDKLVEIAKFGIGHENNATASIVGLDINAWIEPYTHQNKTELLTNLATAVQNGFLSKQTASERCPDFPKNAEWERILREKKEEDQQDLLMDIQRADNETENAIEEQEATARINKQQGGNDINTGGGRKAGRPNRSGKKWDKNRNNDVDDKNNWKRYNQTH